MLIFGLMFYQILPFSTFGSPSGTGRTGRSSVFSLFNLKERSRFWSEAVIRGGMHFSFSLLCFM